MSGIGLEKRHVFNDNGRYEGPRGRSDLSCLKKPAFASGHNPVANVFALTWIVDCYRAQSVLSADAALTPGRPFVDERLDGTKEGGVFGRGGNVELVDLLHWERDVILVGEAIVSQSLRDAFPHGPQSLDSWKIKRLNTRSSSPATTPRDVGSTTETVQSWQIKPIGMNLRQRTANDDCSWAML
ncbi:hypothetical protein INR49_014334 [Caranx melampygus]|nr:hypothetical protein INR49_014334 [Caranx melampygus]